MNLLLQLLLFILSIPYFIISAIYKEPHIQAFPGTAWIDLTLASGTGTFECPFGTKTSAELFLTITQFAAAAVNEGFSWSISGTTITIDSSNASSTAVLKIKVESI